MPRSVAKKRMRVQLQEGADHTHSKTVEAVGTGWVTPLQLRKALEELFRTTPQEARWFPWNDKIARKGLGHAVTEVSKEIKQYAEHGTDPKREGNILRKEWTDSKGREFRLDIENFGGSNLREMRTPAQSENRL